MLDGLLDGLAGELLVLLEDEPQLREAGVRHDAVEDLLVGAQLGLAGGIQLSGLVLGLGGVHRGVQAIADSCDDQGEQTTEEAGGLAAHLLGQGPLVALLVGSHDLGHLLVGLGAEYLHQGGLLGAHAGHGGVQLLAQVLHRRHHQAHDHVLELAAQLALQVVDQVALELRLVDAPDGLPLQVGPPGEDVDDLLLVGAESLHGGAQGLGVGSGVEGGGGHHRGHGLKTDDASRCKSIIAAVMRWHWAPGAPANSPCSCPFGGLGIEKCDFSSSGALVAKIREFNAFPRHCFSERCVRFHLLWAND